MANFRSALSDLGQDHLFGSAYQAGSAADKARLDSQLGKLDGTYPGGLASYVTNARAMLAACRTGANPLDGWEPSVPVGETLEYGTPRYVKKTLRCCYCCHY